MKLKRYYGILLIAIMAISGISLGCAANGGDAKPTDGKKIIGYEFDNDRLNIFETTVKLKEYRNITQYYLSQALASDDHPENFNAQLNAINGLIDVLGDSDFEDIKFSIDLEPILADKISVIRGLEIDNPFINPGYESAYNTTVNQLNRLVNALSYHALYDPEPQPDINITINGTTEKHTTGTQIDLFYSASAGLVYISPDNIVNIEALFDQYGLSKDDYFKITYRYGHKFIKFDKQVVPLVGLVPHFDEYDVDTDTAYFTDHTVRLFVLP